MDFLKENNQVFVELEAYRLEFTGVQWNWMEVAIENVAYYLCNLRNWGYIL